MDINQIQKEVQPNKEYYDAEFEKKAKVILNSYIKQRDKIIDEYKYVYYRGNGLFRNPGIGYDHGDDSFSDDVNINLKKNKYYYKHYYGGYYETSREIWEWLSKRYACFLTKTDREKAKKYFPIPTQKQVDRYWLDLMMKNKKAIDYLKKYGENILSTEAMENVKRASTLITDFDIFDDLDESVNENLGMGYRNVNNIIEKKFNGYILDEEFIHDQITEPGPLSDFDHFSARFPDIASSTNSLSRGETMKDIKTSMIKDDYFKNQEPKKLKRGRIDKKIQKDLYPSDELQKTMTFKEFVGEGHADISGGFMGFAPAPGGGMYSNPPGEITSALFGQGEYVAGSINMEIKDPYFDYRDPIVKRKKIKSKKYKSSNLEKIMKLKEFIKNR